MSSFLSEIFEQSGPYGEMEMETRQQRIARPPASRPRPAVPGKNSNRIPPSRQMAMSHQSTNDKEPPTQPYPKGLDPNNPEQSIPTVRYPKWLDPKDFTDFGSVSEPKKEVAVLQEIFQESESEWANNHGYNEQESENGNDWIPPTLRSPGTPPPEPPTRRDGRGQPPLPPADSEPPTVRLPRRFASYKPSTGAPLQKNSPRPSIRREHEIPLMEEIFMEAEDEMATQDEIEFMASKPSKRKPTRTERREDKDHNASMGTTEQMNTKDQKKAGISGGKKINTEPIFFQHINGIYSGLGLQLPRNLRQLYEDYSTWLKKHEQHIHLRTPAEVIASITEFISTEKIK